MPNFARILNALPTHAPFQRAVEVIFALAQGRWYRRHPSSGAVTPISTPRLVVQITRTGATPSTADYDVTVLEDGLGVTVGAQATRSTTGLYELDVSGGSPERASAARPLTFDDGGNIASVAAFAAQATEIAVQVVNTSFAAVDIGDGASVIAVVEC